jgi:hypothetical protein
MKAKGNEQSIVNGARQEKKKKVILARYRTCVAGSVVSVLNHYTRMLLVIYITSIMMYCSSF